MKTCPTCQQTWPADFKLCPRDGARLAAEARDERECPYCAELILKKARVCKHCGRDVEPLVKPDAPVQVLSLAPPVCDICRQPITPTQVANRLRGRPVHDSCAGRPQERRSFEAAGSQVPSASAPQPGPPSGPPGGTKPFASGSVPEIAEPTPGQPQASTPVRGLPFSGAATNLTPQQKLYFHQEYEKQSRSPSTALVLTLLLGGLGAHRFYLRQWGWGIAYLLFCWTFIPAIVAFVECFFIRKRTQEYNEQLAITISQKLEIIFSQPGPANAAAA